jgi:hypothetical protein
MLSALALAPADCALPSLPRAARWRRGAEKHCPRGARHPTRPPKKDRYLAGHDTGVRLRICQVRHRRRSPGSSAPAASDRLALSQHAEEPGPPQRPRPDAEIVCGEVS